MSHELTPGEKTFVQIAEWMGIKSRSFSQTKEKKLQELEDYANFTVINTKRVLIEEVLEPVYCKKGCKNKQESIRAYHDMMVPGKPFTLTNLAERAIAKDEYQITCTIGTSAAHMSKKKIEEYGTGMNGRGYKGISTREWGKVVNDRVELLTDQESELLVTIIDNNTKRDVKRDAMVEKDFLKGVIAEAEYKNHLKGTRDFASIYSDFRAQTGYQLCQATVAEENAIVES